MTPREQAGSPLPGVRGLALLGFPLHPPGRPSDQRGRDLLDVQGLLSQLPPGSRSGETCLANDSASRTLTDDRNPAAGTGFYDMIRAPNACGAGT